MKITKEAFEKAIRDKEAADKVINQFLSEKQEDFDARWERFDKHHEAFNDDELSYAAFARCKKCGAGMAYPKDCGPFHQWTCSNVLKGVGTDKGHTALPFSMYDIKDERQPSANGATTRPS